MAEDLDDELNADDLFIGMSVTDAYGVPLNIMGRHPEEFFSVLGRIVSLAATLENKILSFYQYLVGRSQTEHSELSVSLHIDKSLKELQRLKEQERLPRGEVELAERWLLEAKAITRKRTTTSTASGPRRVTGSCSAGECCRGRAVLSSPCS
jgi:hypothetical protein